MNKRRGHPVQAFTCGDTRIGDLGFRGWNDVSQRLSIADLFRTGQRCGIYVLGFANGERYVGQAKDVVRRYAQHRARHGDIVSIAFQEIRESELSRVERDCIHALESRGLPLRNLAHMSVVQGERDLDLIVSSDEQAEWLDRNGPAADSARIVEDADLRRRYRSRFEQFMQLPHAEDALFLLGTYINAVIPFPRRTELSFWSLSCMPAQSGVQLYARLNLNMQEVLTLEADDQELWAHFHLAKSPFESYFGDNWLETLAEKDWVPDLHAYKPGGHDQFWLRDNPPEDAMRLMVWPVPSDAMSRLNLNLMRKGPTYYSSSHCLDLVDAAMAEFEARNQELLPFDEEIPRDERSRLRWNPG